MALPGISSYHFQTPRMFFIIKNLFLKKVLTIREKYAIINSVIKNIFGIWRTTQVVKGLPC